MIGGLSLRREIAVRRLSRTRANSCSEKAGFCTTSAHSASAPSRFLVSVDSDAFDASHELAVARVAPSTASSSAISIALRVLVPSSSMFAVISASPESSGGLAPPPALTTRFRSTSGRSWNSARITSSPFFNLKCLKPGTLNCGSAPGAGAVARNGASGVSRSGGLGAAAAATGAAGGGRRAGAAGGAVAAATGAGVAGVTGGGVAHDSPRAPAAARRPIVARAHFFTRPMIGASGLGSTVTTTRASFRRYWAATRWMSPPSTAR